MSRATERRRVEGVPLRFVEGPGARRLPPRPRRGGVADERDGPLPAHAWAPRPRDPHGDAASAASRRSRPSLGGHGDRASRRAGRSWRSRGRRRRAAPAPRAGRRGRPGPSWRRTAGRASPCDGSRSASARPQLRHAGAPAGQVDGLEQLGQARRHEPPTAHGRLAGPAAGSTRSGVAQHVAEAQAGAGQQLRERSHHDARRRPSSSARWPAGRTPRPRRRPLSSARGQEAARAVRVRAPQRPAPRGGAARTRARRPGRPARRRRARWPRRRRWSAAAAPGRRPSPGPAPPSRRPGPGRRAAAPRWRATTGHRVRRQRVERLREVEHRVGVQPERAGHGPAVAAVGSPRAGSRHRATHQRSAPDQRQAAPPARR